jgi:hypothetical protein
VFAKVPGAEDMSGIFFESIAAKYFQEGKMLTVGEMLLLIEAAN